VPGLGPRKPVFAECGAAQPVVQLQADGPGQRVHHAAAAEPERIDRRLATGFARVVDRVRVEQHLHLALHAAHEPRARVRCEPAVDVAPDHAVERRARQPIERRMRGVPGRGRRIAQHETFALEEAPHGVEQRARAGFVERQILRVGQADLFGADAPVRRRDEAPGAGRERHAVALRVQAGDRQRAIVTDREPGGARECTLVRRRQAELVAHVGRLGVEQPEQGLQVRQREVAQRGAAAVGQRGCKRDQQVHRPIIPAPRSAARGSVSIIRI
jgi:hypothetical protein